MKYLRKIQLAERRKIYVELRSSTKCYLKLFISNLEFEQTSEHKLVLKIEYNAS